MSDFPGAISTASAVASSNSSSSSAASSFGASSASPPPFSSTLTPQLFDEKKLPPPEESSNAALAILEKMVKAYSADPHKRNAFLSYYQGNAGDVTLLLASRLNAAGISTWYDQDMTPWGGATEVNMKEGIKKCDIFFLLLTPNALTREAVHFEIREAFAQLKKIVVLRMSGDKVAPLSASSSTGASSSSTTAAASLCSPPSEMSIDAICAQGLLWIDPATAPSLVGIYPPSASAQLLSKEQIEELKKCPRITCYSSASDIDAKTMSPMRAELVQLAAQMTPLTMMQRRGTHEAPLLSGAYSSHLLLLSTPAKAYAEFVASALATACPSLRVRHYTSTEELKEEDTHYHACIAIISPELFALPSFLPIIAAARAAKKLLLVFDKERGGKTFDELRAATPADLKGMYLDITVDGVARDVRFRVPWLYDTLSKIGTHTSNGEGPFPAPFFPTDYNSVICATQVSQLRDALVSRASSAAGLTLISPDSPRISVIGGNGGLGKTSIAVALARDAVIERAFHDIFWIPIGRSASRNELRSALISLASHFEGRRIDAEGKALTDIAEMVKASLESQPERALLIVFDDLSGLFEKGEHFRVLFGVAPTAPSCKSRVVFTTREIGVARKYLPQSAAVVSLVLEIESLQPLVAAAMLEKSARLATSSYHTEACCALADSVGYSPYAIQLIARIISLGKARAPGATIRDRETACISATAAIITSAVCPPALLSADAPAGSAPVYRSITASLQELFSKDERHLFSKLGIFKEDTDIPVSLLPHLFDLPEEDSAVVVKKMQRSALVKCTPDGCLQLHDFALELAEASLSAEEHTRVHADLLDTCKVAMSRGSRGGQEGGWTSLAETSTEKYDAFFGDSRAYLFQYLGYHMRIAQRGVNYFNLLFSFDWIAVYIKRFGVSDFIRDCIEHMTSADWTGRLPEQVSSLRLLIQIMRLSAPGLVDGVDLVQRLIGQLVGRLRNVSGLGADIANLLNGALRAAEIRTPSTPSWLTPITDNLQAPGGPMQQSLAGHARFVRCVCSLPDGRLASASGDNTVRVWNIGTGECARVLKGHTGIVYSVCSLPDGRLVSASHDSTIRIWESRTGEISQVFRGHTDCVRSICPLSDSFLASGSDDFTVRIWNAMTGECVKVLEGHIALVYTVHPLPDGIVASGSRDKTIRLWDTKTGECVRVLEGHTNSVTSIVSISQDLLASASYDHTIRIWDVKTWECTQTLIGSNSEVYCACPLSGSLLATGSSDNNIRVWDAATGVCLRTLASHTREVNSLCALSDGVFASGSSDSTVIIWDINDSVDCTRDQTGHVQWVKSICSLSGGLLASGSWDSTLRIFDTNTGGCIRVLRGHTGGVYRIMPLSGNRLISGSDDSTIRVWDTHTGECEAVLEGHTEAVYCLCSLPNGLFASGSKDETIKIWDIGSKECIRTLSGHVQGVRSICTLENGSLLVSGSTDGVIHIWETSTWKLSRKFVGHSDVVNFLYSLPGGELASGSWDKSICIWDSSTWLCTEVIQTPSPRANEFMRATENSALLPKADNTKQCASSYNAAMYMDHSVHYEFLASEVGGPPGVLCIFTSNGSFHCLKIVGSEAAQDPPTTHQQQIRHELIRRSPGVQNFR